MYILKKVKNITNNQLEAIDWKRISESRGVGEITRKLIYNWLTKRGIKSAKNVLLKDIFKQEDTTQDGTKLRLRILELKVEYDKAMMCNCFDLEAYYRFVKYGINEDHQHNYKTE